MQRTIFNLMISWLALSFTSQALATATTLDFDSPVPGTLNDTNGQGTGFTQRLPGSGSSIPSNDPNLNLDGAASHLLITSTRSDFNTTGFGRNLPGMEAPTLLLSGIGSGDFLIRAQFLDLHVDQLSDQIGILVGGSVNNVVRGGVHEGYQAFLINSQNGVDTAPSAGAGNQFQAGQDGLFELGRIGGLWHFRWQNLSDSNFSGSFENLLLPALDSQNDLYVGVFNHDARNTVTQVAMLDYFTVLTGASVPEPVSVVQFGIGALGLILLSNRRRGH